MIEQEKFEAWIRNESRSIDKYAETGEYIDPFVSILHQGWQAAIASREPMEWQPIETAPIEPFDKERWYKAHRKTLFLGHANTSRVYMGSYHFTEKGKGRFLDHQGYVAKPTHWMPLPPPPKE